MRTHMKPTHDAAAKHAADSSSGQVWIRSTEKATLRPQLQPSLPMTTNPMTLQVTLFRAKASNSNGGTPNSSTSGSCSGMRAHCAPDQLPCPKDGDRKMAYHVFCAVPGLSTTQHKHVTDVEASLCFVGSRLSASMTLATQG